MTATKIKLEPCPCGGVAKMYDTGEFSVCCSISFGRCGHTGNRCSTAESAARAWNRMALAGKMERMLRGVRMGSLDAGALDALLAKLGPAEEVERG